jgi:hypothetical protein
MIGLNNEIISIMEPGSFYYSNIGDENRTSKCFVHLVCRSLTTVGVIEYSQLKCLFEVFPDWK